MKPSSPTFLFLERSVQLPFRICIYISNIPSPRRYKVKYKKLSLVILLLFIVPQLVDALHYGNDLIPPFPEGSRIIIESHVIDGATNFFKAKAAAMLRNWRGDAFL